MQTQIVNVQHPLLSRFIQSFIFFTADNQQSIEYSTFPNTNLCLAIYFNNAISYCNTNAQNICEINTGLSLYKSRLYGFHKQPFEVKINGSLDQICILFHPGALRAFTNVPYDDLLKSDNAFDLIFSPSNLSLLERIFNYIDVNRRAHLLESFLIDQVRPERLNPKTHAALTVATDLSVELLTVGHISNKCNIDPSTLYRLFYSNIGQSPKSFLQTMRFRRALKPVLYAGKEQLTNIAYSNAYYDQAHFNKEIKSLSGFSPNQLRKIARLEQRQLAWVYKS